MSFISWSCSENIKSVVYINYVFNEYFLSPIPICSLLRENSSQSIEFNKDKTIMKTYFALPSIEGSYNFWLHKINRSAMNFFGGTPSPRSVKRDRRHIPYTISETHPLRVIILVIKILLLIYLKGKRILTCRNFFDVERTNQVVMRSFYIINRVRRNSRSYFGHQTWFLT